MLLPASPVHCILFQGPNKITLSGCLIRASRHPLSLSSSPGEDFLRNVSSQPQPWFSVFPARLDTPGAGRPAKRSTCQSHFTGWAQDENTMKTVDTIQYIILLNCDYTMRYSRAAHTIGKCYNAINTDSGTSIQ